jgi:hypothetical protein
MLLIVPAVVVVVLVSAHTGFNHHLRYVLPAFPFAIVWMSKAATRAPTRPWMTKVVAAAAAWSVASSLSVYPHSLSYFNELVGGPLNGHWHLADSNVDWGQDLVYLKQWIEAHPEARPLTITSALPLREVKLSGVSYGLAPILIVPPPDFPVPRDPWGGPEPGWHAVTVIQLHGGPRDFSYFLHFQPVARVGYSMAIYHVTPEEANRVRRELGLPEVPGAPSP